jgi:hypothetical protein
VTRAAALGRLADRGAALGLAALLTATVFAQHPQRLFDAVRNRFPAPDLLPDWRFFAPEPGRHDFHVLVRVAEQDGAVSPWWAVHDFGRRAAWHSVWFPRHRHEKALFDVCSELTLFFRAPGLDVAATPPYLLLQGFAERVVRERRPVDDPPPRGFQFLVLRDSGYEEGNEPEYVLASAFIPLDPAPNPAPA